MEAKHLLIPGPVPPDLQHSCKEVQRSHEAGSLLVSSLPMGLIMPCWWPEVLHHAHKAPHHDAQHGINCMPPMHYNALQCITLQYIALHCIIHTKLHTMMFSITSIVCLPLHPHLHVWAFGMQPNKYRCDCEPLPKMFHVRHSMDLLLLFGTPSPKTPNQSVNLSFYLSNYSTNQSVNPPSPKTPRPMHWSKGIPNLAQNLSLKSCTPAVFVFCLVFVLQNVLDLAPADFHS